MTHTVVINYLCYICDTVAVSNPTIKRLRSLLLADPDELRTEPTKRTKDTVDVQISVDLLKVVDMVRIPISIVSLRRGWNAVSRLVFSLLK